MFAWKFSLDASHPARPARTPAALARAGVVAARFGRCGPLRATRRSWDRVTPVALVPAVPGESSFWACVPAHSRLADTGSGLPTPAYGLAVSRV